MPELTRRAEAADPGRAALDLALRRLPPGRAPTSALAAGWTPLIRADRLAEELGIGELWIKNDAANPTHSFKDRVVSVALARAQELGFTTIACASTGNLANAVAAHAAAAGLESYVFIPSDLEEQKVLATGIYGTNLVAVNGNYDDVNRLCTEIAGEHDWAFVNINMRPYYAEGSKTLGVRDRRAARLRAARSRGRADRLRLAVHQGRPRLRGVARGRARRRRAADLQRCSGRGLLAGRERVQRGPGLLRPSSPTRSRSHWRSAILPTAPTRCALARRSGGAIDAVSDDEIRDGIKLLAQTTGIFTETAGGVTIAVLRKLAQRGDIGASERVVAVITGEGLKTLECARGTFEAWEIERERRGVRNRARAPGSFCLRGDPKHAGQCEDPDPASRRHRWRSGRRGGGKHRGGGARCFVRTLRGAEAANR